MRLRQDGSVLVPVVASLVFAKMPIKVWQQPLLVARKCRAVDRRALSILCQEMRMKVPGRVLVRFLIARMCSLTTNRDFISGENEHRSTTYAAYSIVFSYPGESIMVNLWRCGVLARGLSLVDTAFEG